MQSLQSWVIALVIWGAFLAALFSGAALVVVVPAGLAAAGITAQIMLAGLRPAPAAPAKIRTTLDATEDPLFLVAPDGEIRYRNAPARQMSADLPLISEALAQQDGESLKALYRLRREAEAFGAASIDIRLGESRRGLLALRSGAEGCQSWILLPETLQRLDQSGAAPDGAPMENTTLEDLPVALARLDGDGVITFANAAARKLLGAALVPGARLEDLIEGLARSIPQRLKDTLSGKAQGRSEVARGRKIDGYFQVTMARMIHSGDAEVMAVLSDATELKTLEAQFVQSQKMQAVGQLAGGVAHDFNNLLTAINGHCDLLLLRHVQGDGDHADLMQIRQNSNRAASLVRQLLAFSRKQTLRPQVLNLYDTLAELANLLNRLLGEKVELKLDIRDDIWSVRVDERQLEQVIVNLVVNARDAMPSGGVVSLTTRTADLAEALERDRAIVPPGQYCLIEVRDTGTGISKDKITKVFEPFFTTKKVGEGTGLGLSTAYGIIKQMDGYIFVDSVEGDGSVFTIYLPAANDVEIEDDAARRKDEPVQREFRDPTGRGVVLLVEDEAPVRSFAARALKLRGYTVVEAESGEHALEVLDSGSLQVDLFVSDVVMPGIDGPTWVREAYKDYPDASTIFVSGYSQDQFTDGQPTIPRSSYLAKPFTLNDLTDRVREHMDRYVTAGR